MRDCARGPVSAEHVVVTMLTGLGGDGNTWQEPAQTVGGFDAELITQNSPVQLVLPPGLGPVALGYVRLDQRPVGAFPQWFGADGRQARIDGLPVTARHG